MRIMKHEYDGLSKNIEIHIIHAAFNPENHLLNTCWLLNSENISQQKKTTLILQ